MRKNWLLAGQEGRIGTVLRFEATKMKISAGVPLGSETGVGTKVRLGRRWHRNIGHGKPPKGNYRPGYFGVLSFDCE